MPPDEARMLMYNMAFWDNDLHDQEFYLFGSMARAVQSDGSIRYTTANEADGHAHCKKYVVIPTGNVLQPGKIRVVMALKVNFGTVYNVYFGVANKAGYGTTAYGIGVRVATTDASLYHSNGTTTKICPFAGVKFTDLNIYEIVIQTVTSGTTEALEAILNINGRTVGRIDRWKSSAYILSPGVMPFFYLSDDSQHLDVYSFGVIRG